MKTLNLFKFGFIAFVVFAMTGVIHSQTLKLPAEDLEIKYISEIFNDISIADQKYRGYLQHKTTDEAILQRIDSVYNQVGIQEGFVYEKSLKLSMDKAIRDSISMLQRVLDFKNHIMLRGLIDTYGVIPESIIEEKNYVQTLLLLHPPAEWDIPTYHENYAEKLLVEVHAGRMEAKDYAAFYDNILTKILKKPQLYGTGKRIDFKTNSELPPIISDIDKSNAARSAIGLPALKKGEYVLASSL